MPVAGSLQHNLFIMKMCCEMSVDVVISLSSQLTLQGLRVRSPESPLLAAVLSTKKCIASCQPRLCSLPETWVDFLCAGGKIYAGAELLNLLNYSPDGFRARNSAFCSTYSFTFNHTVCNRHTV